MDCLRRVPHWIDPFVGNCATLCQLDTFLSLRKTQRRLKGLPGGAWLTKATVSALGAERPKCVAAATALHSYLHMIWTACHIWRIAARVYDRVALRRDKDVWVLQEFSSWPRINLCAAPRMR